jgi:UDP-galactopyranose mutase
MQSFGSDLEDDAGGSGFARALLCFSHLRWNFVYQRPQHLLSRAAEHTDVFFMEEPCFADVEAPELRVDIQRCGVRVLTPLLPHTSLGSEQNDPIRAQRLLLDRFLARNGVRDFIAWYYTPMALAFTRHLGARVTIYDCMDQLSAFQGAPPEMRARERELFERADVVFTGGRSLFESKRNEHANVHLFPSSIDYAHFAVSRSPQPEPADQSAVPHPRAGFFGVLDERLDTDLLGQTAALLPKCHFVLIGPVVKIREEDLPRADNIHYLGKKEYAELPNYIAHWDAAILPFALNESTRFISPTKTPEYLAAGMPVVSTPIRDVAEPYGTLGLAEIAATPEEFSAAITRALEPRHPDWLPAVDEFLQDTSWDKTFEGMWAEVRRCERTKTNHDWESANV